MFVLQNVVQNTLFLQDFHLVLGQIFKDIICHGNVFILDCCVLSSKASFIEMDVNVAITCHILLQFPVEVAN